MKRLSFRSRFILDIPLISKKAEEGCSVLNRMFRLVYVLDVPQCHARWVAGVVMPREECWIYVRVWLKSDSIVAIKH